MALTKVSYGVITADASSADLNIDANTLFIDSSANKVGIGTNSPAQALDVVGAVKISDGILNAGAAGSASIFNEDGTTADFRVESTSNTHMFFVDGGLDRVGINTASPVGTLHAAGTNFRFDTPDGSGITIIRTGNSAHLHLFPAYSSVPTIMGQGAGGLHLGYDSSTAGIRIDTNNKVGIGTTSANGLLHIGDSNAEGSSANPAIQVGGAGTYRLGLYTDSEGGIIQNLNGDNGLQFRVKTAGEVMRIMPSGRVGIGQTSPSHALHVVGGDNDEARVRVHNSASGQASFDLDNSEGYFRMFTDAGTWRLYDQTDGAYRMYVDTSGKVGINTTSPDELLQVELGDIKVEGGQNASTRGLIIAHTGQTGNLTMLRQDSSGSRGILETTERNLRISAGSGGGTGTAETLDFFTNGVERAHFATDGNFIVGATSGSAEGGKIQIFGNKSYVAQIPQGNITITDTATMTAGVGGSINFAGAYLSNGVTTSYCSVEAYKEDSTSGNYGGSMVFKTRENGGQQTEVMRLTSTNNVGIATTSVERTLDVAGIMQAKAAHASNGGQLFLKSTDASDADDERYGKIKFINNGNATMASIEATSEGTGNNKGHLEFFTNDGSMTQAMRIRDNGTVQVFGALSKGSGSFEIPHPLESKKDSHLLRHSFIEGPQCDNIYRGTVDLVSGTATVDLDAKFTMTNGTFVALNRNVQVFTTNESDWDNVKGSIVGNTLTITCQNSSSNATVSWLVVGERQDDNIKSSEITNNDGKLILEPEVYEGGT